MDYHLLTKKCDGMCDSCECPPAEFECQGEPSLCDNPRGCGCQAPSEPHPSCKTPEGCRENGCLGWCDEYRPDPTLKPDIAALKKRLAEDPGFAAQVTGVQQGGTDAADNQ